MNLIGFLTMFCLIGAFSIIVLKLWNIVNVMAKKEKGYEGMWIFVGMGAYLIFWVFLLQILANDPVTDLATNGIYHLSYLLVSWSMILAILLTIIEFLLKFTILGEQIAGKSDFRERGSSPRSVG